MTPTYRQVQDAYRALVICTARGDLTPAQGELFLAYLNDIRKRWGMGPFAPLPAQSPLAGYLREWQEAKRLARAGMRRRTGAQILASLRQHAIEP